MAKRPDPCNEARRISNIAKLPDPTEAMRKTYDQNWYAIPTSKRCCIIGT
jgi:hypothetical protein